MSNNWFQFKKFKVFQEKAAMKIGIDSVLLGAVASFNKPEFVLDIGSGTGILALMAEQRTNAKIFTVEIDIDAFIQCNENIEFNCKKDKIEVIHSSFQNFAENTSTIFDHIICNPPYFNNSYKSQNDSRNLARQNSYLPFNELLEGVKKILSVNGFFSLILPADIADEFMQLSMQYNIFCFKKINIIPRIGKESNRSILEFSKNKTKVICDEIILRNKNSNEYSNQYKTITKDFYLGH